MTGEISIPVGSGVEVKANLVIPRDARALVVFSHGSGSSRFSSRNNFVAGKLNSRGMATLLADLLTPEEDSIYENRFDIGLLTTRLYKVTAYIQNIKGLKQLPTGYFGASTGAASSLRAAADPGLKISAVVSRGGRPDLAADKLSMVVAPTLLIVGGLDDQVITLNREAFTMLNCVKDLKIVEGASHLFEEPGKLDIVADLAGAWFRQYLMHL